MTDSAPPKDRFPFKHPPYSYPAAVNRDRVVVKVPGELAAMGISRKEWRVLQFIMDGKNNDDIAQSMFIALSTVKTHINNLYKKLAVTHRKAAIARGRALSGGSDRE